MEECGIKVRETLIWNKNQFTLGRQDYQWKHEPCLYGWKDGAPHYFVNDRGYSTVLEEKARDTSKMKAPELRKLVRDLLKEQKVPVTVIDEDKPLRSEEHPTMKPIRLIGRLIANSSRKNELVLDSFAGSGSTLIACEELGRRSCLMELDPKFVDVIIGRWEKYTGQKAQKL
jgi:DNA modification methylase